MPFAKGPEFLHSATLRSANGQPESETIGVLSRSGRAQLARKLIVDLSIMATIGVILALVGPFGSFQEPLGSRLAAWLTFAFIGYAIYSPMSWVVDRLEASLDLPRFGLWVAACLFATAPMTAVVWIFQFYPWHRLQWPSLDQFATQYFYVLVIGGGVTALFHLLERRGSTVPEAAAAVPVAAIPPAATAKPRFMDHLSPELGSDLIALEMEDHYVRAHTALGSELVLMRLRDAIADLDGVDGMQVHRSWWVARGAVEDIRRDGRTLRLVLAGGLEAPVSRANVSVLRQAGWV